MSKNYDLPVFSTMHNSFIHSPKSLRTALILFRVDGSPIKTQRRIILRIPSREPKTAEHYAR